MSLDKARQKLAQPSGGSKRKRNYEIGDNVANKRPRAEAYSATSGENKRKREGQDDGRSMTKRARKNDNDVATMSTTRKKRKVKASSRAPKLVRPELQSRRVEPWSNSAKVTRVESKTSEPLPARQRFRRV